MAKKIKKQGKKRKNVVAKDGIIMLFDQAFLLAEDNPEMAKKLIHQAFKAGQKVVYTIPAGIRQTVCSSCYIPLLPGKNCSVRIHRASKAYEGTIKKQDKKSHESDEYEKCIAKKHIAQVHIHCWKLNALTNLSRKISDYKLPKDQTEADRIALKEVAEPLIKAFEAQLVETRSTILRAVANVLRVSVPIFTSIFTPYISGVFSKCLEFCNDPRPNVCEAYAEAIVSLVAHIPLPPQSRIELDQWESDDKKLKQQLLDTFSESSKSEKADAPQEIENGQDEGWEIGEEEQKRLEQEEAERTSRKLQESKQIEMEEEKDDEDVIENPLESNQEDIFDEDRAPQPFKDEEEDDQPMDTSYPHEFTEREGKLRLEMLEDEKRKDEAKRLKEDEEAARLRRERQYILTPKKISPPEQFTETTLSPFRQVGSSGGHSTPPLHSPASASMSHPISSAQDALSSSTPSKHKRISPSQIDQSTMSPAASPGKNMTSSSHRGISRRMSGFGGHSPSRLSYSALERENQDLLVKYESVSSDLIKLTSIIEQYECTLQSMLKSDEQKTEHEVLGLQRKIVMLKSENETLEKKAIKSEDAFSRLKLKYDHLKSQNAENTTQLTSIRENYGKLTETLGDVQQKYAQLRKTAEEKLSSAHSTLIEETKRRELAEKEAQGMRESVTQVEDKLLKAQSARRSAEEKIEELQHRIKVSERERKEAIVAAERARKREDGIAARVELLESTMSNLQEKTKTLTEELEVKEGERQELADICEQLLSQAEQVSERERKEAIVAAERARKREDRIAARVELLESTMSNLQEKTKTLTEELEVKEGERQELADICEQLLSQAEQGV
ncbi:Ribonuclease P subunit, Rpr2/Snm1/Rpp21 like protein [Aduncisulcus paluster]|uniref:Ribonuclease P subunit, Rpr2/Snm1/Rpp21 like protein n=1 Tax=Aduncisulcus paluster TaxID=2918883 RepID=A0ABQ5K509_9EUKA|nr:Ribonuclease P subunit, Rpr2/Snm1/Rpp21 like protein [Aduncisulcus paluster]